MPVALDLQKQCPQIYIYIFSVLASVLVTLRYESIETVVATIIAGTISTFILMGINLCDWKFQWVTWLLAAGWMLSATASIIAFFESPGYKKRNINTEEY